MANRELRERLRESVRKGKAAANCRARREWSEDEESEGDGELWERRHVLGAAGTNQEEAGPSGLCAKRRGQPVEGRNVRQRGVLHGQLEPFEHQRPARSCPLGQGPLP